MGLRIEVEGLDRAERSLDPSVLKEEGERSLKRIGLKLESLIKVATVVRTGALRASIHFWGGGDSFEIGTNCPYAPYVEYGTWKMESRHMEGAAKVLGEGGSFAYGMKVIPSHLNEEEKRVAMEYVARVERGG